MANIDIVDRSLAKRDEVIEELRFSKFVHCFIKNGIVAIYHSLTHQAIYLNSDVYEGLLERINKEIENSDSKEIDDLLKELIKKGFIVSIDFDEAQVIQAVSNRFLGKPAFRILYLLLTDLCNLRCRYCFIEGAMPIERKYSLMSEDTAIKGLNLFARLFTSNPRGKKFAKSPSIFFYGGEPLLNKPTFVVAVNEISRLKKADQLPQGISVVLITNATVIDDDVSEFIAENKVSVSVSLDGPKDFHDANRIFVDQGGTFEIVLANIKRLQRAGVKVSISCTINKQNVDFLEQIFQWIVDELEVKGLGFNMLLDLPGAIQADERYVSEATDKIIACYQIAREKGVYEDRIMRKINAFVKKRLHLVDCGGCGNQIVVAPDGSIGPCQAYLGSTKFFSGHVNNPEFNPFKDPVFLEWSSRSPFNIPSCHFCEAIGLCGGGCLYNADLKYGSIWKADSNFCIHSKKVLEWLIWDLFKKTRERR